MLNIDEIYHGFRLIANERVDEIQSDALTFVHETTKAQVIVLPNEDDNKSFIISFRTPPSDDTGVAHILEHSVLNGSQKYPVKEPFAELLKCSLYTFLNAMTYPDRTVYPVASRNGDDFRNLMDVYLDAVFRPLLSEDTFLQEGWHYELDPQEGDLTYTGVVYNEMLGVYSDPENVLVEEMNKALYPQSIYGRSSGGDPEYIPELSYAEFKKFHRTYYHPSNAKIIIYGDIDVEEKLAHLQEYLADFEYQRIDSMVEPQPRLSDSVRRTASYAVTSADDSASKVYAIQAYLIGHATAPESSLALSILSRILSGRSASPLRKALIDSHLGESTLNFGLEQDVFDTNYSIGLRGMQEEQVPAMEALIESTLKTLVTEGIDSNVIRAAMNSVEFQLREANFGGYPKGLCYGLTMLSSWAYDDDPLMHIRYEEPLRQVKEKVAGGAFFEELIQRYFLDNHHKATVGLTPDDQLEAARVTAVAEKLAGEKNRMSDDEQSKLVTRNKALHDKQLQPDPPEALATLPRLSLSSIDRKAEDYPIELIATEAPQITFTSQPTNGIAYLIAAFDVSGVPQELLPYLPIFAQLTLQIGTAERDFVQLSQDIDIHTGGLAAAYTASSVKSDMTRINSLISYSGKCIQAEIPNLLRILAEIFASCDFDNLKRIREVIQISKSSIQSQIIPSGHSFAARRLASYSSRVGQYREIAAGISQYYFLDELDAQVTSDPDEVCRKLKQIADIVFRRGNLMFHITGGDSELRVLERDVHKVVDILPTGSMPAETYEFAPVSPGEGFIIPSKIQYVGKGINLFDHGYEYHGGFEVLDTILSRDYMWNNVRVLGGAYGCFARMDMLSGNFYCVSYRDPNLAETLMVFDRISDYLSQIQMTDEDYERYIIGTIGTIDSPKTPDQKGAIAFGRYLADVTSGDVQRWRDEVLTSTRHDLREYQNLFRSFGEKGCVCVFGSEEKIHENAELFSTTRNALA